MAALDFPVADRWSGARSRGLGVVECRAGGGGIKEGRKVVVAGPWYEEDAREWRN